MFVKLVSPNPANRPSFDQILEFAWFCEPEPTLDQYMRIFEERTVGGAVLRD